MSTNIKKLISLLNNAIIIRRLAQFNLRKVKPCIRHMALKSWGLLDKTRSSMRRQSEHIITLTKNHNAPYQTMRNIRIHVLTRSLSCLDLLTGSHAQGLFSCPLTIVCTQGLIVNTIWTVDRKHERWSQNTASTINLSRSRVCCEMTCRLSLV